MEKKGRYSTKDNINILIYKKWLCVIMRSTRTYKRKFLLLDSFLILFLCTKRNSSKSTLPSLISISGWKSRGGKKYIPLSSVKNNSDVIKPAAEGKVRPMG